MRKIISPHVRSTGNTEDKNTEFEEVEIPKEILDKAGEGSVLKYTNGKYEYFSDEGMETEN